MGKISDEIRDFVRRSYADEYMDPKELLAIADRADRELVDYVAAAATKLRLAEGVDE